MKITYAAANHELTPLANLLKANHRGPIRLTFTAAGVLAEVDVRERAAPARPAAAAPLARAA